MKKRTKGLLSILLAIVMMLAMALPVSAAETGTTTHQDKNTTTVPSQQINVADKTDTGVKLSLYKIIDVMDTKQGEAHSDGDEEMVSEASALQWVTDEIREIAGGYTPAAPFAAGTLDLTNPANLSSLSQAEADAFYQWLAGQIRRDETLATKIETPAQGTGATALTYTYSNLEVGGYLAIADDGVNVYRPTAVRLLPTMNEATNTLVYPTNPGAVSMKATKPDIEKLIIDDSDAGQTDFKTATVARGDSVTFQVRTGVPVYSGDYNAAEIRYAMVDIMRISYAYTADSLAVKGYTDDADTAGTTLSQYAAYTGGRVYADQTGKAVFVEAGSKYYGLNGEDLSQAANAANAIAAYKSAHSLGEGTTITASGDYTAIVVDFLGNYSDISGYKTIGYEYKAQVTDSELVTVDTNTNAANLAYSVNGTNPKKTTNVEDEVVSYTYGIDVTKRDGADQDKKLNGVYFDLYELAGTMTEEEYDALKAADPSITYMTENAADGKVKVYQRIQEGLVTGGTGEDGSTPLGQLQISGLDQGEYWLVETQTVEGYNKLESPIPVKLQQSKADKKFVSGSTTGYHSLNVDNYQGVTLPSTGGVGTTVFTILGIILMAGAMILVLAKRRRES